MHKGLTRPPIIALVLLILAVLLNIFWPGPKLFAWPFNFIGIVLAIIGLVFMYLGWKRFQEAGTTIKPEEKPSVLVTAGIYRISRNPMYLGLVLILLGIAIVTGSTSPLIAPVAFFFIINYKFISYEEWRMERIFGQKYLDYKKRVRRWI